MKTSDITGLVRSNILKLCPYSTARDELTGQPDVFLDANESPYPSQWNRYPDPRQKKVKELVSKIKGCATENIFLGNGSDEAIDLIFRIFCTPGIDNIVAISPSYGMYSVCAAINDIECREVLLEDDFSLDIDKLLSKCDTRTKAIFLCSPNNPSGNGLGNGKITSVLDKFEGMVIVDEAYNDFSDEGSLLPLIGRYPNLVILQTCSKSRGLAALRLGIAFSNQYVISLMNMVKYPYNISEANQQLVVSLLSRDISSQIKEIKAERSRVSSELSKFRCISKVFPSQANFILVRTEDADKMYDKLIADGIIVRNRTRMPLCKNCLRITIGLKEENDKLLKSIERYENEH